MRKSLAGSLLFFAFVSATYAGEIRIGEERPLTPIGLPGPAAFEQYRPAVASNGRDAVCYGDSTVRAIRLTPVGDQLDLEPFDVAPGVLRGTPSIVPTVEGVDIIYSRYDADNGQAPRAFARSLARLPPLVLRRHAVR
jgi:hypothetical protein